MDADGKLLETGLLEIRKYLVGLADVCGNTATNLNLHIAEEDKLKNSLTWLLLRIGYVLELPDIELTEGLLRRNLFRIDVLRGMMITKLTKLLAEKMNDKSKGDEG